MKGSPKTMQDDPMYGNAVEEILHYLQQRMAFAIENGIEKSRLVIDPGIGFGKTDAHNFELLRGIPTFGNAAPVLIGASRKSLIGRILERENPADRLSGSLAVAGWAAIHGAHILRVHDVIDTCDVCCIMDTLCDGD
jgi:dihydropteroate synthase